MSETTLKDGGEGRLHDDRNVATDELLVMLPSFDEVMRQVDELLDGGRHDALQDVGPTLKRLRLSSGLSLAEVASRTGIASATLSRLETGKARNPTIESIVRIVKAMGKRAEIRFVDGH